MQGQQYSSNRMQRRYGFEMLLSAHGTTTTKPCATRRGQADLPFTCGSENGDNSTEDPGQRSEELIWSLPYWVGRRFSDIHSLEQKVTHDPTLPAVAGSTAGVGRPAEKLGNTGLEIGVELQLKSRFFRQMYSVDRSQRAVKCYRTPSSSGGTRSGRTLVQMVSSRHEARCISSST